MYTAKAMTPKANVCSLASVTWHFWHSVFVVKEKQKHILQQTTCEVTGKKRKIKWGGGKRGRGYEGNWEGTFAFLN